MAKLLKQSTACTIPLGPFVDDADGKTPETSLTVNQAAVRLRKNGGAAAQANESTTAPHDENGYYLKPLNTTDTGTLGRLQVCASVSGALPVWDDYMVIPATIYDSLVTGSGGAIPNAVAGAAGGLLIAGSNAATTFATLTISDGLVVAAATTDRSAATFTGNGTGSGLVATGGGSSGSSGINASGTIGITAVGTGASGWGISASGTSSAGGLRATSTAASGFTISGGLAADSIAVSGATSLATLATSGTTTLNALTVTNATTLSGAVSLGSTLGITGKTTFTGAVAMSSTLSVADTVTFTKGLVSDITGTLSTVTTLTNLPAITSNWLTAAGLATDAVTEIAGGVWDLATSGHTNSGTFGEAMSAAGASGDPWTTTLPGSYTSGQAGYILGTNLNGTITSRMATYTQPTGFLSATFPGTVASTTNITAGTITTVTDGVALTAAGLASVAAEIARVARGYANVYYVDPAGNDSNSGLTPTLAKLTLAGAKSAAAAGSLIVVMAGTYNERNHFKNGVDWLFTPGADANYTGSAAGGMWDDSANGANGAVVCRVMGYGRFIHATTGTTQLRPVVRVSNSGSRVLFECLDILNQCSSGTNNPDGVYHSDGELRLKVIGDVSSTQTAGLYLGGLPATAVGVYEAGRFIGSTTNGAGISVQGSTACNFVVIAKYVKATPIAIDLSDYAGTDAQFHVDHVETSGASGRAVYFDGPTLNATATFWNGTFIGTAVGASSAAMECDSGGLVRMYNCRVVNTGVDGAAIGCYGGRVELFNCMVYGGDNAGYDIDTEGTVVVSGTSYRSARTSGTITVAEIQAGVATQTSVNTIDDLLDTEMPALTSAVAALPTATANADALLGRNIAGGSSTGRTVSQALYGLRNKVTRSSTTLSVYLTDDTTVSWTAALTTDAGAIAVTEVDPG